MYNYIIHAIVNFLDDGQPESYLANYNQGLLSIGSISATCEKLNHYPVNSSLLSGINNFHWPNMAEIIIENCHTLDCDIKKVESTMPNLQWIHCKNCSLESVPELFPWRTDLYYLPQNMSRTVEYHRQYTLFKALQLHSNVYNRALYLDNNKIGLKNDSCLKLSGYLFSISLVNNNISTICSETFINVTGLQVLELYFQIGENILFNLTKCQENQDRIFQY